MKNAIEIRCIRENELGLLKDFLLYKEYRRKGIGTRLMEEMLENLRDQGYKRVSLAVQKANYAVKMYQKTGFRIMNENDEEFIMVCEL